MNPTCQILVLEDDFQHVCQLFLLVSGETGHESLMMLASSLTDSSQCALAIGRQVKRIEPAVPLGGPALHQAALLQFVQNANQTACVHAECIRQILLRKPRILRQDAKDPRVVRREAQRLKALGEFRRCVISQLRQQKACRSGAVGWILSVPEVLDSAPVMKALAFLNFLLGGVAFSVGFGLLAAGISVTSYFSRLLPRWVAAVGMVVAIAGELSSFSLIAYPANFFIPITRFVGFIWMLSVAITLAKSRKPERASNTGDPQGIAH